MSACDCCDLVEDLARTRPDALLSITPRWTLNQNVQAIRPSLVLQTRRHVDHLGALTDAETDDLSRLLPDLDVAMRALTGAVRTHFVLIAESAPHVHWHLIPRFEGDPPGAVGLELLSLPAAELSEQFVSLVAEAVGYAGRSDSAGGSSVGPAPFDPSPVEPSPVVRHVVALLDLCQRFTPYEGLRQRWAAPIPGDSRQPSFWRPIEWALARMGLVRAGRISADAATVYVGIWLAVLAASVWVVSTWPDSAAAVVLASVAALRAIDVASFQLRVLLDRRVGLLASFRRSLLFLGVNIVEMVVVLGALLVAWCGVAPALAFRNAFGIVTLTDAPATPSSLEFGLRIGFTAISIVLLAGAGGLILGLVGRAVEEGAHESKPEYAFPSPKPVNRRRRRDDSGVDPSAPGPD